MKTSFEGVKYGFAHSPCSPRFSDEEPDGIKIAAPAEFNLFEKDENGDSVMLPFCVTLRFDAYYLSKFDQVFRSVKVVAVDDEHRETLSGGIWRDRHYRRKAPSEIPAEELKRTIATEYYTINLLEFFHLPMRKATYKVYALLEEHKSNVVTIRVDAE